MPPPAGLRRSSNIQLWQQLLEQLLQKLFVSTCTYQLYNAFLQFFNITVILSRLITSFHKCIVLK